MTTLNPATVPLNPRQHEAVVHPDGPLLIFAGAGSGKTLVITQRIVHLIEQRGVAPQQIIALTFTNKAAGEMRQRVATALGPRAAWVWISTFHAACTRILRRHGERIGLPPNFVIYDADDQKRLLKHVLTDLRIDTSRFPVSHFANRISRLKRELKALETLLDSSRTFGIERHLGQVYQAYDRALRANGAVDFDDLLRRTIQLWEQHPEVLAGYRERLRHVLVDEYQDTNAVQWRLLDLLCREHQNLCVVGDDDQSIYRWRGAEVGNILEFSRHFPAVTTVTLSENYRSTQIILDAAAAVVAHNTRRHPKHLFTRRSGGEKIVLGATFDEEGEAAYVTQSIETLRRDEGIDYSDMAVFFRTNAQSRLIEDSLRRAAIPYQVVGGLKFYDRKEVKDLLGYMRVIANPLDSVSLRRIINVPQRGIGATTVQRLLEQAAFRQVSLYEAIADAQYQENALGVAARKRLAQFLALVEDLRAIAQHEPASATLRKILERTKYIDSLQSDDVHQAQTRIENLHELINAAADFEEEAGGDAGMAEFLDHAALVSDQDSYAGGGGAVTLMTLHASKGLEFGNVFMTGMEEGLFPHRNSLESQAELEEERRLCYVGMTRAKNRLYMTCAASRRIAGQWMRNDASRFLDDLPREFVLSFPAALASAPPGRRRGETRRGPTAEGNGPEIEGELTYEYEPDEIAGGYRPGLHVRHPTFGVGVVRTVSGRGDKLKLTVNFQSFGMKKLMAKFAALERVS